MPSAEGVVERPEKPMIRAEVAYDPDPKRSEEFWDWFIDVALKAAAKKQRHDDEAA